MTYQNFVIGQLAALAVREGARHGGFNNMLAVAQVMRNRVSAGWAGGDWMKILATAPGMVGTVYPDNPALDPRDLSFRQMLQRIDDVYHGAAEDLLTDGALYYAELHDITAPWFQENILDNLEAHPILGKVGQVTFFG